MSGTNISSWPKKRTIFSHRLSHEMNKKKLDLSLSNVWVEGKSKLEVSSENLNQKQQHFQCREKHIRMDGAIEFLDIGKRTCRETLGTKKKGRRLKWYRRVEIVRELTVFGKECMKSGDKKLVKMGRLPMRTWRIRALEVRRRKD